MNPLAEQLNAVLAGTSALELLSSMGKRFYFPRGIVAQAGEAGEKAHTYNATVGMACVNREPMHLFSIKRHLPDLNPDEIFSYSPTAGIPGLREAWRRQIFEKNPGLKGKTISLPVLVSGVTCGLSVAADLFVDAGDAVLLPDLRWDNYSLVFADKMGAELITYPLFDESGGYNTAGLGKALKKFKRGEKAVVVFNFPNNPTGYTLMEEEKDRLLELLLETAEAGCRLCLVLDDAYFGLFYGEGTIRESLFASFADLHENVLAVKLDGATKEDFVWGFRIGFITYGGRGLKERQYDALVQKTKGIIRATVSNSSTPAQNLLLKAYSSDRYAEEKKASLARLTNKYRLVREILDGMTGDVPLKVLPFNSGYFMCFELKRGNAEKLRRALLLEDGTGTIAMDEKHLRVAYAGIDEQAMGDFFGKIFKAAVRVL
ncbi:MAG: aminotransferase class I/II-fold pyridoxal phosphate-dependent enzyme [Spirochaetales bacterium]|nr:aminotransferase class I/II-fold pyridoxal phosphate-dependent enzyme [Spirochaetales bacterium]